MSKRDTDDNIFSKWFKKIGATRRTKAVCKPCWEIKFCPYGPLVEDFPLAEEKDPKRCMVFGHVCPVFLVAEPFTETAELRRITRTITRPSQFRILRRDNNQCRHCGKHILDDNIHFDHVIPWSKGGSSDENNLQILCKKCNKTKSNALPKGFLISSAFEHMVDPWDANLIVFLKEVATFRHKFLSRERRLPDADDFARCLSNGEKGIPELRGAELVQDWENYFQSKPAGLSLNTFRALKRRWGYIDGKVLSLNFAAKMTNIEFARLFDAERAFVSRMGFRIDETKKVINAWKKT